MIHMQCSHNLHCTNLHWRSIFLTTFALGSFPYVFSIHLNVIETFDFWAGVIIIVSVQIRTILVVIELIAVIIAVVVRAVVVVIISTGV